MPSNIFATSRTRSILKSIFLKDGNSLIKYCFFLSIRKKYAIEKFLFAYNTNWHRKDSSIGMNIRFLNSFGLMPAGSFSLQTAIRYKYVRLMAIFRESKSLATGMVFRIRICSFHACSVEFIFFVM